MSALTAWLPPSDSSAQRRSNSERLHEIHHSSPSWIMALEAGRTDRVNIDEGSSDHERRCDAAPQSSSTMFSDFPTIVNSLHD